MSNTVCVVIALPVDMSATPRTPVQTTFPLTPTAGRASRRTGFDRVVQYGLAAGAGVGVICYRGGGGRSAMASAAGAEQQQDRED
jgi:hypothetical protein